MSRSHVLSWIVQSGSRRLAAAAVLSTAALLSIGACSGQSATAAVSVTHGPTTATATASGSTTPATVPLPAATGTASTGTGTSATSSTSGNGGSGTTGAAAGVAPCRNAALQVSWGTGSQSEPEQYSAIDFVNVSDRSCTLYGYPGLAIRVDGTVINAARTLDGAEPPLKSPQPVTLAPGGKAYAVAQWELATSGKTCYPTGTGTFEATAPNTTRTFVLSTAGHIGKQAICSGLAVNPVQAGTYGVATGS
jgi:Protein of unknown function (DUF4232)